MNFWDVHGIFFILFLFFLPRTTLFFGSLVFGTIVSGGFLWWVGWLICPRLLVAILATTGYWDTNPILVVMTWIWALGGEGTEKSGVAAKSGGGGKRKKAAAAT